MAAPASLPASSVALEIVGAAQEGLGWPGLLSQLLPVQHQVFVRHNECLGG